MNSIHICCIQETHLKEGKPLKIRGYREVSRGDRQGRSKGGVLTLVRNDINASETSKHMEEVWIHWSQGQHQRQHSQHRQLLLPRWQNAIPWLFRSVTAVSSSLEILTAIPRVGVMITSQARQRNRRMARWTPPYPCQRSHWYVYILLAPLAHNNYSRPGLLHWWHPQKDQQKSCRSARQ